MQNHFADVPPARPIQYTGEASLPRTTTPSSSRMFAAYLSDVEQMLDEQRWDAALRDASNLPLIAVALSDPHLCSSSDRCKEWCEEWIQSLESAGTEETDHNRAYRVVCEHIESDDASPMDAVPSNALHRLRLRRHARIPPRGFSSERFGADDQNATEAVEICTALVEAARRWYAHSACHDAVAQANLARLAVLR